MKFQQLLLLCLLAAPLLAEETKSILPYMINYHEYQVTAGQRYRCSVSPDKNSDIMIVCRLKDGELLVTNRASMGGAEVVDLKPMHSTLQVYVLSGNAGAPATYQMSVEGAAPLQSRSFTRKEMESLFAQNKIIETPPVAMAAPVPPAAAPAPPAAAPTPPATAPAPPAQPEPLTSLKSTSLEEPNRFELAYNRIDFHTFRVKLDENFSVTFAPADPIGMVVEVLGANESMLVSPQQTSGKPKTYFTKAGVDIVTLSVHARGSGSYAVIPINAEHIDRMSSDLDDQTDKMWMDYDKLQRGRALSIENVTKMVGGEAGQDYDLLLGHVHAYTIIVKPGKHYNFQLNGSKELSDLKMIAFPNPKSGPGFRTGKLNEFNRAFLSFTAVEPEVLLLVLSPKQVGQYNATTLGGRLKKVKKLSLEEAQLYLKRGVYSDDYSRLFEHNHR